MEALSGIPEMEKNSKMVEDCLGQASRLPLQLAEEIQLTGRGNIRLYGLLDLMPDEAWLILSDKELVVGRLAATGFWELKSIAISSIDYIKEIKGLSSSRLVVYQQGISKVWTSLLYSHRQNGGMGQIKYLLETQVKRAAEQDLVGTRLKEVEYTGPAQHHYLDELLEPLKKAQATSSKSQSSVVWRLLSYLKPYKKQVALGMGSAVLMTVVSLLPPMLTGYIELVRR